MKQFIFGFIAALALIAVGGLAYIKLGLAPVATASPPLPFERLIAETALQARVNKEAGLNSIFPQPARLCGTCDRPATLTA